MQIITRSTNNIDNTIFFGMYNSTDYKKLNNHKGKKWIFWCGSDFEINSKRRYKCIKKMLIQEKNLQGHLCKIKSIYNNLNILDLNPILINDNLDDFTKSENLDKFNKLVSIILPTLNRLEGFKNVVNQILNQTYENFELIIVDDGSDNDILIKKEEFINSLNNNKIKMLKNIVNKNLPYSINKGINNSNGDFITWISDDNNYYNIFIESLVHQNYDFIYSNFELYFEDLGKTKNIKKKYNSINDLISNYAGLASFMYSRNLINKIGLYNTNLFKIEDYEYLLRIYNNTDKIKHIPISTMNYKRHSESLYAQNENNINKMSEDVNFIYQTIQNNKFQNIFLYYSKTR